MIFKNIHIDYDETSNRISVSRLDDEFVWNQLFIIEPNSSSTAKAEMSAIGKTFSELFNSEISTESVK